MSTRFDQHGPWPACLNAPCRSGCGLANTRAPTTTTTTTRHYHNIHPPTTTTTTHPPTHPPPTHPSTTTTHHCHAHPGQFAWIATSGTFTNPAGVCVGRATAPPPPPPPPPPMPNMSTCDPTSPVTHERFCDTSLPFEARAAALVSNLTLDEKTRLWTVSGMRGGVSRLNVKGFQWDSTCIHGPPFNNVTVTPHAINQVNRLNLQHDFIFSHTLFAIVDQ
jgi:hypothetical protein